MEKVPYVPMINRVGKEGVTCLGKLGALGGRRDLAGKEGATPGCDVCFRCFCLNRGLELCCKRPPFFWVPGGDYDVRLNRPVG